MIVIGVTGGIGSGKSRVAEILKEQYGAIVFNTDRIAREQMEPGGESYKGVVDYFGKEILREDGSIDREKLAAIVFRDNEKLRILNGLTHPPVIEYLKRQMKIIREQESAPFMVIETALIIESGLDAICDVVWYVYASEEIRRERLKQSRNYSDSKIDSIFANQSKDSEFRLRYPVVIDNNDGEDMLRKQIDDLVAKTRNPAAGNFLDKQ